MNCKVVAVILALLALALMASVTHADSITIVDSSTTTDGTTATVDAGNGQLFTCDSLLNQQPGSVTFECTGEPSGFICFGWSNCAALGATVGWALVDGLPDLQNPMSTPEPGTIALLAIGLVILSAATAGSRALSLAHL